MQQVADIEGATARRIKLVPLQRPAFPVAAGQGIAAQDAQHPKGHPWDTGAARFPILDGARGDIERLGSFPARHAGLPAQVAEVLRVYPAAAAQFSLPVCTTSKAKASGREKAGSSRTHPDGAGDLPPSGIPIAGEASQQAPA